MLGGCIMNNEQTKNNFLKILESDLMRYNNIEEDWSKTKAYYRGLVHQMSWVCWYLNYIDDRTYNYIYKMLND